MTNFDYLKKEKKFTGFVDVAIAAERIVNIDPASSIIDCRRAMEFAIKWMYSVDTALERPYQDKLISLMSTDDFHGIVDDDLWRRLDLIRRLGNIAAHNPKKMDRDQAVLCLKNLYIFFDFIAYCYADHYDHDKVSFDEKLLEQNNVAIVAKPIQEQINLDKLVKKNKELEDELSKRSESKRKNYTPKHPLKLSEFKTRKIYIDSLLADAGWTEDSDWINEYRLEGMPNASGIGFADYVLLDNAGIPQAVIEAKKTCVDISKGRQQAQLYANSIEKKFGRRPYIFLTNGFEISFVDNEHPERRVSGFYSKRDLEKLRNLQTMKQKHLDNIEVDDNIAGRYYQKAAIKAVCESFDQKNKRKALLVMATGSGKTRTAIALCKVFIDAGWVRNILFLADRTALVTQAKRNFVNLLPTLSCTNLTDKKRNLNARCIFSTYQTMLGCIDSLRDDEGKLFTVGHFDLIIIDEAHRSIYNKYRDIFNYFDAPMVGLTATPKDEIDKNTYSIFELEDGVPTYGYELAQAVKDGYLVDFVSIETKTKFLDQGIKYDDLSEKDKETYEDTFEDEDGKLPRIINPTAINNWIFNKDTIKKVLHIVMKQGLKINYGEELGKTIIFAKNHKHAEAILDIFNQEFPELAKGKDGQPYAKVIDNYMTYAQSAIDEFSEPDKLPQIAISVDMLDTGIDVPECLNLVFFKPVYSKAKFWQMIGRGTRLCPGLIDGKDKDKFYIFDFCGNFEFFRMSKGKEPQTTLPLQGALFNLEFQLVYKLQDINYQTNPMISYRKALIDNLVNKVKKLNRDNFAVKQHIKDVDEYANVVNYQDLTYDDCLEVREEVSPLILPDDDEVSALRFDALILELELANISQKPSGRYKNDIIRKITAVSKVANIPEINAKKDLIEKIINTDYLDGANIQDLEMIRKELRDLIKYIPKRSRIFMTDFNDEILDTAINEPEYDTETLKNYKAKVEYYIAKHQKDNKAILKLKNNRPINDTDLKELEKVFWKDIGTKEDYTKEYGDQPLGEFIRSIVGLDMKSAKTAFAEYLNEQNLNSRQIYFLNQIIEFIVKNGMMKDLTVLQGSPFTDQGNIIDLFGDNQTLWQGIMETIQKINNNANVVA